MNTLLPKLFAAAVCWLVGCAERDDAGELASDAGRDSMVAPSGGQSGTGGAGGSGPATGGATTGGASAAGGTGAIPDLTQADGACRTGGGQSACMECCDTNHAGAYTAQAEQTRACACTKPGTCAAICSDSYCMSQPQTVRDCYSCVFPLLRLTGACFGVALEACGSDASCRSYVRCRANCAE
jgi:hypothetical protein